MELQETSLRVNLRKRGGVIPCLGRTRLERTRSHISALLQERAGLVHQSLALGFHISPYRSQSTSPRRWDTGRADPFPTEPTDLGKRHPANDPDSTSPPDLHQVHSAAEGVPVEGHSKSLSWPHCTSLPPFLLVGNYATTPPPRLVSRRGLSSDMVATRYNKRGHSSTDLVAVWWQPGNEADDCNGPDHPDWLRVRRLAAKSGHCPRLDTYSGNRARFGTTSIQPKIEAVRGILEMSDFLNTRPTSQKSFKTQELQTASINTTVIIPVHRTTSQEHATSSQFKLHRTTSISSLGSMSTVSQESFFTKGRISLDHTRKNRDKSTPWQEANTAK